MFPSRIRSRVVQLCGVGSRSGTVPLRISLSTTPPSSTPPPASTSPPFAASAEENVEMDRIHAKRVAEVDAIPEKERRRLFGQVLERYQQNKASNTALNRALFGVLLFLAWQYATTEGGGGVG